MDVDDISDVGHAACRENIQLRFGVRLTDAAQNLVQLLTRKGVEIDRI